eukprot:15317025-Alexandrium_andersonii.AAC.1
MCFTTWQRSLPDRGSAKVLDSFVGAGARPWGLGEQKESKQCISMQFRSEHMVVWHTAPMDLSGFGIARRVEHWAHCGKER